MTRQLGCRIEDILDVSASINPFGPPRWLAALLADTLKALGHYPDPDCHDLILAASRHYTVPADELVADNGTAEIMHRLMPLLGLDRAVIPMPCYSDYERVCTLHGKTVQRLYLRPESGFALDWDLLRAALRRPALVFLGHPNNPTGHGLDVAALRRVAVDNPESWFVVDEAFADFAPTLDRLTVNRPANMVVLLSLTKFYALPGLRIGLAAMNTDMARCYKSHCPAWSVNTLAQAAGARCLDDDAFRRLTWERLGAETQRLQQGIATLPGLHSFPSQTNFLLCKTTIPHLSAGTLAEKLRQKRIAIRVCDNFFGLDQTYFRVATRLPQENDRLLEALDALLTPSRTVRAGAPTPGRAQRRATPALMVQGTCSNAGKSLLCAALGRILLQDGFCPAPFKAQNMALNSAVTPDGGEIGRAQALQAQACGLEPDRRMNPILLKPNSETGSQVIVLGRPRGNMDVSAYIRAKQDLGGVVRDAYDSLCAEHDVMVLEGAGSPAEINLKSHDLVNMAMARYARAAVLLVGDIDRGGVFAALAGTLDLLDGWEQDLVRGLVINKFRGQQALLDPALEWIARRTGKPVLGVVPHVVELGLPEEDSVTFKQGGLYQREKKTAELDVVCLDLPHISNFTDLDPLAAESDVALRLVCHAHDLGRPDLLILPGSKNVLADLAFLRTNSLDRAIAALVGSRTTEVVGICGGLQMLGQSIRDPYGVESSWSDEAMGLCILSFATVLEREKTLCRTEAVHLTTGLSITGYEIHHGRTDLTGSGLKAMLQAKDGRIVGCGLPSGWVWGTYLHGVFENAAFRRHVLNRLRHGKGLVPLAHGAGRDVEASLDRLADIVRASLNMDLIYDMLGGM